MIPAPAVERYAGRLVVVGAGANADVSRQEREKDNSAFLHQWRGTLYNACPIALKRTKNSRVLK
jgi:hypothetical protein